MKKLMLLTFCCMSLSFNANQSVNPETTTQSMKTSRGYLFSLEGTEGCGKTTLIQNLKEALTNLNLNVVTTREPGGSPIGQEIRSMLMNRTEPLSLQAEFLLFAADRAEHFKKVIIPNLEQNNVVISDRMADSSRVYQGYVKGLDQQDIQTVNAIAMQHRTPDLVFYLKIDCDNALIRVNKRNLTETQAAFEKEILQKKQQLVDGYDAILSNREDVIILDATASPEEVTQQALKAIIDYIQTHND